MKSLVVNGTELCCVDRGTGSPLLLVHGFPLDHTMWAGQIGAISSCCRVIAPDLRGFGQSPAQGDTVTMEQFADDLAALLDVLGVREPVVFCGLSMGGYIAFRFCRKYAARLRGLILCDTRATADSPEVAAGRRVMAERVVREGTAPLMETMLPKLFAERVDSLPSPASRRGVGGEGVIEGVRRVMMAADPRGIAAAARGMAERPDMTLSLGQIRCPTLVVVGQNDAISPPAEMRAIAASIPGAKFVEISAAGHMAPLENPAEVNAAICGFLSTL